ncbi:MAG: diaminopimelate epimerase [Omnitrophica bacterium RIFCSPHIGHO2_02_FULL_46_11]|nr:MAG: diaminopimelate epimerase [Omnitrophica bacterium RIFCSPHIGHO2_02_FULL_46_11]OGW87567.1 MAG: diaminopimelate epimerase [Omnitrophica bacterium RIFCSPLOWO2_01_FULL_45_10b]
MGDITFHKMVASGNDFVVIDNRKGVVANAKQLAVKICQPHFGVGADGVLFIEPSRTSDFFLRIVNSDGSEAEACGNGYRCVGLYAHQLLGFSKSMRAETLAGEIGIEVNGSTIKAKMANPSDYRETVEIKDLKNGSKSLRASFINTGVPHVVIFAEGLDKMPVVELGRVIRYHKAFQPKGTNVNFVEVTGKNELSIRTYERGVEDETLACGTGTVASAVVSNLTDRVGIPVSVKTKSGETLKVYFDRVKNETRNVFLEGKAEFVFEGSLSIPSS